MSDNYDKKIIIIIILLLGFWDPSLGGNRNLTTLNVKLLFNKIANCQALDVSYKLWICIKKEILAISLIIRYAIKYEFPDYCTKPIFLGRLSHNYTDG